MPHAIRRNPTSHKIGEVHDGEAHMDYLAEEQAHGDALGGTLCQRRIRIPTRAARGDAALVVERRVAGDDGLRVEVVEAARRAGDAELLAPREEADDEGAGT